MRAQRGLPWDAAQQGHTTPPFICRLVALYITYLTLIVFVIVIMHEIVLLVPRALYLIDWTAISGT
jgi:hypothetical protein